MPYRLTRADQSLTALIRRLADEELGAALAHAPGSEGAVHDSRKRVKKLRAALRLVRAGLPAARVANATLRDAAQGLSGLRDAEVMLTVCDSLAAPDAVPGVRAHLAARLADAAADPGQAARAAAFRDGLAAVLADAAGWKVRGKDGAVLQAGLARTRRQGRAAMAAAREGRDPEAMHDFRKRVKDLWYLARLLQPVWPALMDPLVAISGDLGEELGRHHDLTVFAGVLDSLPPAFAAEVARLRTDAALARDRIEVAGLAGGARLLAGDPAATAAQWVEWWRLWRTAKLPGA